MGLFVDNAMKKKPKADSLEIHFIKFDDDSEPVAYIPAHSLVNWLREPHNPKKKYSYETLIRVSNFIEKQSSELPVGDSDEETSMGIAN